MTAMSVSRGHARPGPLLQGAALGQALTALVLARQWSVCDGRTALVLVGTVLLASLLGAWALWLRDAFETRTSVGMVAAAVALGSSLAMTVGMPGGTGGEITPTYALLGALSVLVLALLGIDTWHRTRPLDG